MSGTGDSHPAFGLSSTVIKKLENPVGIAVSRGSCDPGPEGHRPKLASPSVRHAYVPGATAPAVVVTRRASAVTVRRIRSSSLKDEDRRAANSAA